MKTGSHHDAAARAKMAATHRAIHQVPWNKGRKMAEESRAKMGAAKNGKSGHPHSPEAKWKIRAAMIGKRHALGCRRSAETRTKMGGFMRGRRGALSPFWKGGRKRMKQGYIRAFAPGHPHADPKGYVFEHRLVMEARLGRYLDPAEVVHHINGIKDDNRDENLMLFATGSDHRHFHRRMDLVGKVPAEILKGAAK